jgi:hypothetical protein
MITIFCDFRQFSAKKLVFFSKTNVMIKILHNLPLFWVKNGNFFRWIFRRKYFKIHNIGPRKNLSQKEEMKCFRNRSFFYPCLNFSGQVLNFSITTQKNQQKFFFEHFLPSTLASGNPSGPEADVMPLNTVVLNTRICLVWYQFFIRSFQFEMFRETQSMHICRYKS